MHGPVDDIRVYQKDFDAGVAHASGDMSLATRPTTGEGLSYSPHARRLNVFEGSTQGEYELTRR